MNKELIKTYKSEFNHWLNGGNVQVYYKKDDEQKWWTDEESIACDGNDNFSHIMQNSLEPEDVLIVIDDSYSIYRKAMAEGKIVQEQDYFNKQWLDMKTDDFHGASDTRYEGVYRIKPEGPKFKTGDFVIHNGVAKIVTKAVDGYIDSLDNEVAVIMKEESLELWEPNEGEWCIMYDIGEYPDANSVTLQRWNNKSKWKPIPFIGKLPPYIKK
jgi:hypothetical protein